jgi:hypothetical protein
MEFARNGPQPCADAAGQNDRNDGHMNASQRLRYAIIGNPRL